MLWQENELANEVKTWNDKLVQMAELFLPYIHKHSSNFIDFYIQVCYNVVHKAEHKSNIILVVMLWVKR